MTKATVASTSLLNSAAAGTALGQQIIDQLGTSPDVVFLFAAQSYQYAELLSALKKVCQPKFLLGCAAYREYTRTIAGSEYACAAALSSADLLFSIGVGRGMHANYKEAAKQVVSSFQGREQADSYYRYALLFMDVISVFVDDFIQDLTLLTHGDYQFFGCGAAEDTRQRYAPVFYGDEVLGNSVVALEFLSPKPLGIGSRHAWIPATFPMLAVTEKNGSVLKSLDGRPALDVFRDYADLTGQDFNADHPVSFFIHNMVGLVTDTGYHRLRLPFAMSDGGSLLSYSPIPSNSHICIMKSTSASVLQTVARTTRSALNGLCGSSPALALYMDCRASYIRLGGNYSELLQIVHNILPNIPFAGCNIYGQIVRSQGQYSGFHNCTPSLLIIPE